MSKIAVRIQAHPSRAELLPPLLESLSPLSVEVSTHAANPPNPWLGYQRCLTDIPDCTHLLILQEDVTLCPNFPLAVKQVADANPEQVVVLFLARLPNRVAGLALHAAKRRERYLDTQLRINEFMPIVAVLWSQNKAKEFKEWTEANPNRLGHPEPRSDDGVCGRWAALTRQKVRFTIPSLVQHLDNQPSVIGKKAHWGRDRGRTALYFCESDPLDLDWR